jgi:hypothetical protein
MAHSFHTTNGIFIKIELHQLFFLNSIICRSSFYIFVIFENYTNSVQSPKILVSNYFFHSKLNFEELNTYRLNLQ